MGSSESLALQGQKSLHLIKGVSGLLALGLVDNSRSRDVLAISGSLFLDQRLSVKSAIKLRRVVESTRSLVRHLLSRLLLLSLSDLAAHNTTAAPTGVAVFLVHLVAFLDTLVGSLGMNLVQGVVAAESSHELLEDKEEGSHDGGVDKGANSQAPLHVALAVVLSATLPVMTVFAVVVIAISVALSTSTFMMASTTSGSLAAALKVATAVASID